MKEWGNDDVSKLEEMIKFGSKPDQKPKVSNNQPKFQHSTHTFTKNSKPGMHWS